MRKRILSFVCIVMVVFFAGCNSKEISVIGKWQSAITKEITIEFTSEGIVREFWQDTITNEDSQYTVSGNEVTVDQYGDKYILILEGDTLKYLGDTLYTKI